MGRGAEQSFAPDGDSLTVYAEYSKARADAEWTIGVENSGTWPSWPMHFAEPPTGRETRRSSSRFPSEPS